MGGPWLLPLVCIGLVVLVPVVLFLLTYIFRLSCALCGLPKPSVLAAAGIMFVNFVADAVALTVLEGLVGTAAVAAGLPGWEATIITRFLDLPVDLAISSGLHAALMGIRFGKAIEIWYVQRSIQLALLVFAGLVAVIVYLIQA